MSHPLEYLNVASIPTLLFDEMLFIQYSVHQILQNHKTAEFQWNIIQSIIFYQIVLDFYLRFDIL